MIPQHDKDFLPSFLLEPLIVKWNKKKVPHLQTTSLK